MADTAELTPQDIIDHSLRGLNVPQQQIRNLLILLKSGTLPASMAAICHPFQRVGPGIPEQILYERALGRTFKVYRNELTRNIGTTGLKDDYGKESLPLLLVQGELSDTYAQVSLRAGGLDAETTNFFPEVRPIQGHVIDAPVFATSKHLSLYQIEPEEAARVCLAVAGGLEREIRKFTRQVPQRIYDTIAGYFAREFSRDGFPRM